ncbi:MAG: acetylornithine carbamoyltransferase [Sediminibacterium sp.]|nr:acetylornithine carbamoyltransferase [Sediminibacterium sp.]
MKKFTSVSDIDNLGEYLELAKSIKKNPLAETALGVHKTLGLIFLNPSLRTRLSMQKAAQNLGLNTIVLNTNQESWNWEIAEQAVMNSDKVEHIKDAAKVMSLYCDILAIRSFPKLENKADDYNEHILEQFIKYSKVPVISLESATRHPLQSFADVLTISENSASIKKPKVLLTWAPHIKPLPQAVANSFCEWMQHTDYDFSIAHPQGYELDSSFTQNTPIYYNQNEALKDIDFVYVKNWSSFTHYGKILPIDSNEWLLNQEKMNLTNQAKIMHCLPVRRNVEIIDELLDNKNSLIYQQAENRIYSAQTILKKIIESL